jgi:hypothetical protein
MKNLGKWMLGAAIVAGGLGLGTTTAQAAQFRVYVGGSAYVPPCPGPGYVWAAGYYDGGYWVPGRWNYVGVSFVGGRNRFYDHDRGFYGRDRDDHQRYDRDDHRRNDRDDHRDRDRDHDRNRH